jgi:hypothetical protein
MKIWIPFLFVLSLLIVSCTEEGNQVSSSDSSVENSEQNQQKKQTSRPSAGPLAPIYLGQFSYKIGALSKTVKEFKSGYNDISLTDDNITIRITDMNGTSFLIVLKGADFSKGGEHEYKAILSGTNQGPEAMVTYMSKDESFQWKSGVLSVTILDPKSGKFVASMKNGEAVEAKNITSTETIPMELNIDMRFENVVNLAKGVIQ